MKSGAIPENTLEQRMLGLAGGPRVTVDVLVAPLQARCVMLATRLGVWEALDTEPRDAAALARALRVDPEVLAHVLRMLWSAGYLWSDNGLYELTALSRTDLLPPAGTSRRAHVLMCDLFWNSMSGLDEALRLGRGIDSHGVLRSDEAWRIYEAAMLEGARDIAPLLVPYIPVRQGARSVLDLAGSHGLLGALLCRAHPPMKSEVLELPAALDHSRALACVAGIQDLVEHRAGDILLDDFGADRDVILLSNVLHHLEATQVRSVIARAARALSDGGTLSIVEIDPPRPEMPPDAMRDATALFFRVASAGQCHPVEGYCAWLKEAGLSEIRVQRSRLFGYHCLVLARKIA
jgi:SAM-dependent methyltransferase